MITVLYIGGCGRSGSTLLDRMLGAGPGAVAVGELVHLVQRGLIEDEACGCGSPFRSCPFWMPVMKRVLGTEPDAADVEAIGALQQRVDRNRHIGRLLAPRLAPGAAADLERYTAFLGDLYRAIATEAGTDVVVDSSKHASTAFVLRRVPGIDLHVVHLVRDSRGVAHSWTKAMSRPEGRGDRDTMRRHPPARSAARWLEWNGLFEVLDSVTPTPVTRVRYEDLVAEPRRELDRVLDGAAVDVDRSFDFLGDGWVELSSGHSVSGNPMRFSSGRLPLRVDAAWQREMAPAHRRVVTAITAPMLAAYGYLGSGR